MIIEEKRESSAFLRRSSSMVLRRRLVSLADRGTMSYCYWSIKVVSLGSAEAASSTIGYSLFWCPELLFPLDDDWLWLLVCELVLTEGLSSSSNNWGAAGSWRSFFSRIERPLPCCMSPIFSWIESPSLSGALQRSILFCTFFCAYFMRVMSSFGSHC